MRDWEGNIPSLRVDPAFRAYLLDEYLWIGAIVDHLTDEQLDYLIDCPEENQSDMLVVVLAIDPKSGKVIEAQYYIPQKEMYPYTNISPDSLYGIDCRLRRDVVCGLDEWNKHWNVIFNCNKLTPEMVRKYLQKYPRRKR